MISYDEEMNGTLPEGLWKTGAAGGGYEVLARFQNWRVAVITYAARFERQNLYRLERHMETDEVFVLMDGEAVLFIGPERIPVDMELYAAYNVKCKIWHSICLSSNAKVLICENNNTGAENTEYMEYAKINL